jgi:hypothetical protein
VEKLDLQRVRYGDLDAGGIGRYGLMNKLAF